jgi:hypothetical protein
MKPILSLQQEYHHFDWEKAINVDNDRSEAKEARNDYENL